MEFLRQILSEAGADTLHAFTVVPSFGAYFKGVKAVTFFSPTRIELTSGAFRMAVSGSGLRVGRYYMGDLFVAGCVSGVSVE